MGCKIVLRRLTQRGYHGTELHFRSRKAPVPMRLGARQAGTKFALLAGLRATSRAPKAQRLFRFELHGYTMHRCWQTRWSIVTSSEGPFGLTIRREGIPTNTRVGANLKRTVSREIAGSGSLTNDKG
jgi:hypothetical protein